VDDSLREDSLVSAGKNTPLRRGCIKWEERSKGTTEIEYKDRREGKVFHPAFEMHGFPLYVKIGVPHS
jgi:hypothetical protein